MRIKNSILAAIILVVIFGGVALTSSLGLYNTKTEKVPITIKDGEYKGSYDPADIRGSYSFGDIEKYFDIPLDDLGIAFGVTSPDQYADYQCKNLESTYGELADKGIEIGTGSVRYFVALYKGLPIDVEEGTYLPKSAVEILKEKATLSSEQIQSIEQYSIDLNEEKTTPAVKPTPTEKPTLTEKPTPTLKPTSTTKPTPTDKESSTTDKSIKGSTTFQNLLDWGVNKSDIEKVLNASFTDSKELIKDFVSNNGGEFGTIKSELQSLVDKVK